jgi:peptidoglycan/xylan/chitin deacetylase (PgdA/CDA1 family)
MTRLLDLQRRVLRRLYFEVLSLTRRDERELGRNARAGHALILNLHGISPRLNPYSPSLHPDLFAELLEWLGTRCTVALLRELPELAETRARRPFVVLSFDDGYKAFVEHAMPILDRFGFRANQNVIGESVESGVPPSNVRLFDFLEEAPLALIRRIRIAGFEAKLSSEDPLAKERFGAALGNHLKGLSPRDHAVAWSELEPLMQEVDVRRPTRMMSVEDVAAAATAGHEIGAHSYSHRSMASVDDDAFLADLARCREVLARAGCDCRVYAFPNGSYRPAQVRLLQDAGVDHVLLVGERPSRPAASVHTRITLRGHSLAELRARAAGLPLQAGS